MDSSELKANAITPSDFHQAVVAGAKTLIKHKTHLNEINVFPVADGDTGSNMASTANAIVTHTQSSNDYQTLFNAIADAALIGARGNSGLIFSEFFCELSKLAKGNIEPSLLDLQTLSEMIHKAVGGTIASIQNPVEGTIISVMRAWSESLAQQVSMKEDIEQAFTKAQRGIEKALKNTTNDLSILKDTHLVDAGAQGFVYFTKGLSDYFCGKELELDTGEEFVSIDIEKHVYTEEPCHRYCTEGFVEGDAETLGQFKRLIEPMGDSFVFAATDSKARFHIHTNEPWELFDKAEKLGAVSSPKVDDMLFEYLSLHKRKHDIALVTDSSADISSELKDSHPVHQIPINIQCGESQFVDKVGLSFKTLYRLMRERDYPTTSQPSPYQVSKVLDRLSAHYPQVLVISLGKVLSGTYQAMKNVADDLSNVTVIDSRSNAGGQGLLIGYAAKLIDKGLSFSEVVDKVKAKRDKVHSYIAVNKVDAIIRSGRINAFKALLAKIVQIKPLVGVDKAGAITLISKPFSQTQALKTMIEEVKKIHQQTRVIDFAVLHVDAIDKARAFAKRIEELLGLKPQFILNASPSTSLHAGFGALGLAIICE